MDPGSSVPKRALSGDPGQTRLGAPCLLCLLNIRRIRAVTQQAFSESALQKYQYAGIKYMYKDQYMVISNCKI